MPKYKILREDTLEDMEESINQHMDNGWRLFGELKVSPDTENSQEYPLFTYHQPMLKIDELIN